MRAITAPEAVTAGLPRPWHFLAGAIDQDRAEPWQGVVVAALREVAGTVLNPRRVEWDASWGQDLDDARFAAQVDWELDALERADAILCWLPAGSQAPISLMELGLHARRGRLVVGCPAGFHRRGNVRAVCHRFGVPHLETLDQAVATMRCRLSSPAGQPP